jgi:hypothetical protein
MGVGLIWSLLDITQNIFLLSRILLIYGDFLQVGSDQFQSDGPWSLNIGTPENESELLLESQANQKIVELHLPSTNRSTYWNIHLVTDTQDHIDHRLPQQFQFTWTYIQ